MPGMEAADFLPDDFIDEFPMDVPMSSENEALIEQAASELYEVAERDQSGQYIIHMSDVSDVLPGIQSQPVYTFMNEIPVSSVATMPSQQVPQTYSVIQPQPELQQAMPLQQEVTKRPHLEELHQDEFVDADEQEHPEPITISKSPKPRMPRRTKKKKDPNAPAPVMSAYAYFFKDTQVKVKAANPDAKFGDVSRSVAAMWEALDEQEKAIYRNKSAEDRNRFNREMEVYKSNQPATTEPAQNKETKSVKVVYLGGKTLTTTSTAKSVPAETPVILNQEANQVFQSSESSEVPQASNGTGVRPEDITDHACIRDGCSNLAIKSPEWEDEYCSNFCAIQHCKDVFASFVSGRT